MTEREYSSQSAELLLAHELTAFCHSDSLSEEGLHEIIVHHNYLTPNNNETIYIPNNYTNFLIMRCTAWADPENGFDVLS